MAYQSNIPLPTDRLRNSQGDLNGNFQTVNGGIGTMLNPNQGLCQFPVQAMPPTISANTPGLYCQAYVPTTFNELWVQNSQGVQTPMTAALLANTGWSYEPSGLLKNWGFIPLSNSGTTINYAKPYTTLAYSIQLTLVSAVPLAAVTTWFSATGTPLNNFNFNFTGGGKQSAYFFAVGV
jgi:hypothetical protein